MKIMHLGGCAPLTNALALSERDAGHSVEVRAIVTDTVLVPERIQLDNEDWKAIRSFEPDVIHLHLAAGGFSFGAGVREGLAEYRRAHRNALVISLHDMQPGRAVRPALDRADHTILDSADLVLATTPSALPLRKLRCRFEFLSLGLSMGEPPPPLPRSGPQGTLRVLFADWGGDEGKRLSSLPEIAVTTVRASSLTCFDLFVDVLNRADLFIERLDGRGHGVLALLAMAHGVTTLSGNPKELNEFDPALKFSPILHTTADTVERRLAGLAHERRAIRDLSKRGHQYVEQFHRYEAMVERLLGFYRELRGESRRTSEAHPAP